MQTPEIKGKQPDIKSGIVFIDMFIFSVDCLNFDTDEQLRTIIINRISHATKEAVINNLSSIFLNLDYNNQLKFLSICGFDSKQIVLPPIENWKDLRKQLGLGDWDEGNYTIEHIRSIATSLINEWDIYPHALVWVRRFLLFANNNENTNTEYQGEKFGSYPNWAEYFMQLAIEEKKEFVNKLISYK